MITRSVSGQPPLDIPRPPGHNLPSAPFPMLLASRIGRSTVSRYRDFQYLLAVLGTTALVAVRPRNWRRTVSNVLARQVLFTGVLAVGFMSTIAFVVGISVVLQAQVWLTRVGQSQLLGPLLVVVVVRELAPLLTNLVLIIRSASAIAAEMGQMKLDGQVNLLDAQGLDPLIYLVMPRVIGMGICALALAIVFILVAFVSGYGCGVLIGVHQRPGDFLYSVLGAVHMADVANLLAKSILPAVLTAGICCIEGLGVQSSLAEIPRATSVALSRSVIALFLVSAIVSLLTYL